MAKYSADDAEDETTDAQMALDQTRSECVRPNVLHLNFKMGKALNWRGKYFITRGLIMMCLPYVSSHTREAAIKLLDDETERFENFITKNKDKHDSGVDWSTIEEADLMERQPYIEKVWLLVQQDLAQTHFLPWALESADAQVEASLLSGLLDDFDAARMEEGLE